jgi:hypothetical protein
VLILALGVSAVSQLRTKRAPENGRERDWLAFVGDVAPGLTAGVLGDIPVLCGYVSEC